jgi:hypothetical protein
VRDLIAPRFFRATLAEFGLHMESEKLDLCAVALGVARCYPNRDSAVGCGRVSSPG